MVHEITIKPGVSQMVEYDSGKVCCMGLIEGMGGDSVVISPGLNQVEGGKVWVDMSNYSDKEVVIKAGKRIAILTTGVTVVKEDEGDVERCVDTLRMSKDQTAQVRELVTRHSRVFSSGEHDVGFSDQVPHSIALTDNIPIRLPHRRIPPNQWEEVKTYIEAHLSAGIIRPSTSPYSSPMVLVKKKDGSIRVCVDFRQLNAKTIRDAHPLPRIEKSLDCLSGAEYFSTLDLSHGFLQCALDKKDIQKTAFSCGAYGLYEYTRMPMGLINAPATFSRLMQAFLKEENLRTLVLYLDDVLVFSKSWGEMLERLDNVFKRLSSFGLKLEARKCRFFQKKTIYLGYVVSKEGISADPEKVRTVHDWPVPSDKKDVRSFLGLASYYRKFIKGFAAISKPLNTLLAKDENFKWSDKCSSSFNELNSCLSSSPILSYPNFQELFILETDASLLGLGAILSQGEGGEMRVIAYASRGLRGPERNEANYSSMRLELLALKWALTEKFRDFCLGSKIVAYTDNNPLSRIKECKLSATDMR